MIAEALTVRLRDRFDGDGLRGLFPGAMGDQIRMIFAEVLRSLAIENLTAEQKQAALDWAQRAYDQFVRPLDLPYVPAFAEDTVDDWIWFGVEQIARKVLAL